MMKNDEIATRYPVDTGRKLNAHKTFRRRPGRRLNVLCTFNLRPVSTGTFTCLKSTMETPGHIQSIQPRRSGVVITNFEQILRTALVFPLLTLSN